MQVDMTDPEGAPDDRGRTVRFQSFARRALAPLAVFFACVIALGSLVAYGLSRAERSRAQASVARIAMSAVHAAHRSSATAAELDAAIREACEAVSGDALALIAGGTPARVVASSRPEWTGLTADQLPNGRIRDALVGAVRGVQSADAAADASDGTIITRHLEHGEIAVVAVAATDAGLAGLAQFDTVALAALGLLCALAAAAVWIRITGRTTRIAAHASLEKRADFPSGTTDAARSAAGEATDEARDRLAPSVAAFPVHAIAPRDSKSSVILLDELARIVWVNEDFTKNTGYTIEEVRGRRPCSFLIAHDADPQACAALQDAVRAHGACRAEFPEVDKHGRSRWVDLELQPMRDASGGFSGFTLVHSDITAAVEARNELLRSERRQKLIVAGANLGTWDWHIPSGEVHFNDRWCRMLGYEPSEIEPHVRSWEKIVHPEDGAAAMAALNEHFEGRSDAYSFEHRLRAKDGSVVWVLDAGKVYERDAQGKPVRMAGIHLDVTKRRAAEERYELVVRGSAAAIWDWNILAGEMQLSQRWHELLGQPAQDAPATFEAWIDCMHPQDRDRVRKAIEAHLVERSPCAVDLRLRHASGDYRWFHAHGQAGWDNDGHPIRMAGSLEDIHEKRVAETARARLAAIVESSEDAILSLSMTGQIIGCNDAATQMFGIERDLLIGSSALRLSSPAERGSVRAALQRIGAGERVNQYETKRSRADGREIEVSVAMFAVRDEDGQVVGAAKIIRDISERREKIELQRLNTLLEQQNRKLEDMTDRAHRFVDDVSHEFRTPLTVIKEYTSIIADGLGGPVTPKQSDWLQVVDVAAGDLNQMVEDFLDSSKLRAGRLRVDRRPCTADAIYEGVRKLIARKAASRSIRVELRIEPGLPQVFADAEKVRRIVMNLVTNAIKFSPDGGTVCLTARLLETGDVEFGVADQGPGLAQSDMHQLFQRFSQLPNALAPSVKGFGLGLNIARQLVWLNLGVIRVESEPGKGATFSFTLPTVQMERVIDRFFDRLAERDERPESVAMLRVWPDELEGRASLGELRRLVVASTRPSDIVVDDGDGASVVLFGPTSSAETWHMHILEGLLRRNAHGGEGPRVEICGRWEYPTASAAAREAIRAAVLREHAHAA